METLKIYLSEISSTPLLSSDEELKLGEFLNIYRTTNREKFNECKNVLIEHNLRLPVKIAYKFNFGKIPILDLIQEGNIALMNAAELWDCRLSRFSTYAYASIYRSMINCLQHSSGFTYPRDFADKMFKVAAIRDRSVEEISEEMQLDTSEIESLIEAIDSITPASLDSSSDLYNYVGVDRDDQEQQITKEYMLSEILDRLSGRNRDIMIDLYGLGVAEAKSIDEVAKKYKLTRGSLRKLESKIISRLRLQLGKEFGKDELSW